MWDELERLTNAAISSIDAHVIRNAGFCHWPRGGICRTRAKLKYCKLLLSQPLLRDNVAPPRG